MFTHIALRASVSEKVCFIGTALREKINYRSTTSHCLYPIIERFCPDGSSLQHDSELRGTPQGEKGHPTSRRLYVWFNFDKCLCVTI